MIPRIIHQTWKNKRIPKRFLDFSEGWRHCHPGWEWRLWTDADNLRFVKERYPSILDHYTSFPCHIQRVDFIRYLILRTYGGVYVDLDLQCFRNIELLLGSHQCLFSLEHEEHAKSHDVPFIVSNAFMASVPEHPIFDLIVAEVLDYIPGSSMMNRNILESTGPLMLTRVFQKYRLDGEPKLLNNRHLFSLPISTADRVRASDLGQISSIIASDIYGLHWHVGTWWRRDRFLPDRIRRICSHIRSWLKP